MSIELKISLAALAASIALLASPAAALAQSTAPQATPSAAASASASAAPVAPADVTARAKDWLHRMQTGKIDRSQLTPEVNTALTDAIVAQAAAQLGPLGDPASFTLQTEKDVSGYKVYVYRATFKSTSLDENFALDAQGKIAGLRFVPVTTP